MEQKEDTRLNKIKILTFEKYYKVRVNKKANYLAVVIIYKVVCYILLLIQWNPEFFEGQDLFVLFVLEWRYRTHFVYLLWVLNKLVSCVWILFSNVKIKNPVYFQMNTQTQTHLFKWHSRNYVVQSRWENG